MKSVKLLDCTLRDGGYVNDWNFGHHVITGTYRRLDISGADYIEVGFIDGRVEFNADRSIVPDTDCFNRLFEGIEKKHAVPVAMIDYGTCPIENIRNADTTFVDGIRVIFKKEKINNALPFCKKIKDKGYKLFIQAVSITSYSDREMLDYIDLLNEIKPFAFSIVDTYGLLDRKKLSDYFTLIDNNLNPEIRIGYHGHNNFQLAFSNTAAFLGMNTQRELIADATVYGMGKSAGNCPIELLSQYMNEHYDCEYDVPQFLEIFDSNLMQIYHNTPWGYKYNFFISAMQDCHPDYVRYLLEKKTITVSNIVEILSGIPSEKKLTFDADYIRSAYITYQENNINDTEDFEKLKRQIAKNKILLLGPGKSIKRNSQTIRNYIADNKPFIIAINFLPEKIATDLCFISNAKRYNSLCDMQDFNSFTGKILLTSNINFFSDRHPDFIINYSSLLGFFSEKNDTSLLLCLALLKRLGITHASLAGFDGFNQNDSNYFDSKWLLETDETADNRNKQIIRGLQEISRAIDLKFVTPSFYEGCL